MPLRKKSEMQLMNDIRYELSKHNIITFRINVAGLYTKDGRYMPPNVPVGFSDLIAINNGKVSFIEVKTGTNKPSKEQLNFLAQMKKYGCAAGVAYSVKEALIICGISEI